MLCKVKYNFTAYFCVHVKVRILLIAKLYRCPELRHVCLCLSISMEKLGYQWTVFREILYWVALVKFVGTLRLWPMWKK